jgi:hypothetical protein
MECPGCGVWLNEVDGFDRCPVCGAKTGLVSKGKPAKEVEAKPKHPPAEEAQEPTRPFLEQIRHDVFTQEVFLDKRPLEIWTFVLLIGLRLVLTAYNLAALTYWVFTSPDLGLPFAVLMVLPLGFGFLVMLAMAAIIWQAWIYKKRIFWGAFWFFFALSAIGSYNQGIEEVAAGLSYIIAIALLAFLINTNFPKWIEEQKKNVGNAKA